MTTSNNKDDWPHEDELTATGPTLPSPSPSRGLKDAVNDDELTRSIYEAMQKGYLSERHDAIKQVIMDDRKRILYKIQEKEHAFHKCLYSSDDKHSFLSILPNANYNETDFEPRLLLTCIACGHRRALNNDGELYYFDNQWTKYGYEGVSHDKAR